MTPELSSSDDADLAGQPLDRDSDNAMHPDSDREEQRQQAGPNGETAHEQGVRRRVQVVTGIGAGPGQPGSLALERGAEGIEPGLAKRGADVDAGRAGGGYRGDRGFSVVGLPRLYPVENRIETGGQFRAWFGGAEAAQGGKRGVFFPTALLVGGEEVPVAGSDEAADSSLLVDQRGDSACRAGVPTASRARSGPATRHSPDRYPMAARAARPALLAARCCQAAAAADARLTRPLPRHDQVRSGPYTPW